MPNDARITLLLDLLDRAFDKASWHGPNLLGALRRVKPDASWPQMANDSCGVVGQAVPADLGCTPNAAGTACPTLHARRANF
jgi:hypothetical protein